jgi:hypothetical protein
MKYVPAVSNSNFKAQNSILSQNCDLEKLCLLALLTPILHVGDRALAQTVYLTRCALLIAFRARSSGILERRLTDMVTRQLMAAHLSLDLRQIEKPEIARLYQQVH